MKWWKFWERSKKSKVKPDMVLTMTIDGNQVKCKWSIKEDKEAISRSVVKLIGSIRHENLLNKILYTCYRAIEKKGFEEITQQALIKAFGLPVANQPLISPLDFMEQFKDDQ